MSRSEKQLQAACERICAMNGFRRRTTRMINAGPPPGGWFVHLPRARGNPLVLDLLVLHRDGRYLEVELKTATGRVQRHQRQLVEQAPHHHLVRSAQEFANLLGAWR